MASQKKRPKTGNKKTNQKARVMAKGAKARVLAEHDALAGALTESKAVETVETGGPDLGLGPDEGPGQSALALPGGIVWGVWSGIPELMENLVQIGDLRLDPENARVHGMDSLKTIQASLRKFGQVKTVTVDPDFMVLAGNGTVLAAQALGWSHIAVSVFTEGPEKARAYRIADNRTAELSYWDDERLAASLSSWRETDASLLGEGAVTGFTEADLTLLANNLVDKAQEWESFGDEEEKEPEGFLPRTVFSIIFDTEEERRLWEGFMKVLWNRYPAIGHASDRLAQYLSDELGAARDGEGSLVVAGREPGEEG